VPAPSRLGIPKETASQEKRVAATPETVKKLVALGFEVSIERSAGEGSGIADADFEAVGAKLVERAAIWAGSDVVAKVRPPSHDEVALLPERTLLVSLLQPERDERLPEIIAARKASAIALERIPRVTRAQKMDVLSSMANLAGYRAVIEASHVLQQ
jgi:H+-translocating NAD(P) transhydrogenase subunit alpha